MACGCPKVHQFRVLHGHPRKRDQQKPVKQILGSMVLPESNVGGYSGMALEKMKQTVQSQHSDGLLQEFNAMAQRNGEPIGKYSVKLNLAAGKVQLQSCEALGSTEAERSR